MPKIRIPIVVGVSCLAFCSCGVTKPKVAGADSRIQMEQWHKTGWNEIEETDKLIDVKIPIVHFGALPSSFGKIGWSAGRQGQYSCGYHKTASIAGGKCYHVSVFGTPSPAPVLTDAPSVLEPGRPGEMDEVPRDWSTVKVPGLKRSLRYYFATSSFGDIDNVWQSEPFSFTGSDGKTGYYQARVECSDAMVAEAMLSKMRVK